MTSATVLNINCHIVIASLALVLNFIEALTFLGANRKINAELCFFRQCAVVVVVVAASQLKMLLLANIRYSWHTSHIYSSNKGIPGNLEKTSMFNERVTGAFVSHADNFIMMELVCTRGSVWFDYLYFGI